MQEVQEKWDNSIGLNHIFMKREEHVTIKYTVPRHGYQLKSQDIVATMEICFEMTCMTT